MPNKHSTILDLATNDIPSFNASPNPSSVLRMALIALVTPKPQYLTWGDNRVIVQLVVSVLYVRVTSNYKA